VKRDLTKVAVIYDSKFGNTEKIARALSEGMKREGLVVDCLKTDAADPGKLVEYDVLAIGAPTQAFRMSGPMREFLGKLENVDLRGKKGFAFDTRLKSRFGRSSGVGRNRSWLARPTSIQVLDEQPCGVLNVGSEEATEPPCGGPEASVGHEACRRVEKPARVRGFEAVDADPPSVRLLWPSEIGDTDLVSIMSVDDRLFAEWAERITDDVVHCGCHLHSLQPDLVRHKEPRL
jgi:hypothetical protein